MSGINKSQRKLLRRAQDVELERVELTARAMEERVANLLPLPWQALIDGPPATAPLVEVRMDLGITEDDGQLWTVRECREFIAWLGRLADMERGKARREDE